MITQSHRRKIVAVGAGAALALPAAALAVPPAPGLSPARNYSMNSAGGWYAPPVKHSAPAPSVAKTTQPAGDGFAWGDAAAGAGIALLLTGGALGGRVLVRRRQTPASVSP